MNTQDQIDALERNIKDAEDSIELGQSLDRLMLNKDFKIVVLNGYLKEEAIRLVHLKGEPSVQSAESQASIIRDIDSIAAFAQYLRKIKHFEGMSTKSIEIDSLTIDELRLEEITNVN